MRVKYARYDNTEKHDSNIPAMPENSPSGSENAEDMKIIKRNKRVSLIKLVAIALSVIFAVFVSTFSWFTMSRETESNGMAMTATDLPFEIATKGQLKRNESVLLSQTSEYVDGSSANLNDSNNLSVTYYMGDSLILRFDPRQPDNPETTDVDERYLPDIGPGQSGKLNLYIIPKLDSQINVTVSLNITAFAEIDKYRTVDVTVLDEDTGDPKIDPDTGEPLTTTETQQDGTTIIRITNETDFVSAANAAGNTEAAGSANDYVKAAGYLKGHILFFGGEGDTSAGTAEANRFYYTYPYTTRNDDSQITFTFSVPANNRGKAVEVPIYWMWTNTFGQIALPDNVSGQRNGYPVLADDADKASVFRGVIVGNGNTITNKSNHPLIVSSYGCVVKDIDIIVSAEENANTIVTKGTKAVLSENVTDGFYGAVIGQVFGGDNIIDNVTVQFAQGKR